MKNMYHEKLTNDKGPSGTEYRKSAIKDTILNASVAASLAVAGVTGYYAWKLNDVLESQEKVIESQEKVIKSQKKEIELQNMVDRLGTFKGSDMENDIRADLDSNNDPNNCGGNGIICEGVTPFCSVGLCTAGCMGEMIDCGAGACVNSKRDDNNCGGCGNVCEDGKKCEDGFCK